MWATCVPRWWCSASFAPGSITTLLRTSVRPGAPCTCSLWARALRTAVGAVSACPKEMESTNPSASAATKVTANWNLSRADLVTRARLGRYSDRTARLYAGLECRDTRRSGLRVGGLALSLRLCFLLLLHRLARNRHRFGAQDEDRDRQRRGDQPGADHVGEVEAGVERRRMRGAGVECAFGLSRRQRRQHGEPNCAADLG